VYPTTICLHTATIARTERCTPNWKLTMALVLAGSQAKSLVHEASHIQRCW